MVAPILTACVLISAYTYRKLKTGLLYERSWQTARLMRLKQIRLEWVREYCDRLQYRQTDCDVPLAGIGAKLSWFSVVYCKKCLVLKNDLSQGLRFLVVHDKGCRSIVLMNIHVVGHSTYVYLNSLVYESNLKWNVPFIKEPSFQLSVRIGGNQDASR